MTRKYGWIRPAVPADHGKTGYRLKCEVRAASALPHKVDLRPLDTPIEDQGQLGSCTSFGWAGACRFYFKNHAAPSPTPPAPTPAPGFWSILWALLGGQPVPAPSPAPAPTPDPFATESVSHLFIYYNERVKEGDPGQDNGASVSTGGQVVSTLGCPHESTWPYDVNRFAAKPPQAAYADGLKYRVPTPSSIDNSTVDETKTALVNNHPVVFGMTVTRAFENIGPDGIYNGGLVPIGGHCMTIVGYDDAVNGGSFLVRNSWGTDFGLGGYLWLPYSIYTNTSVTSDCWCIAA